MCVCPCVCVQELPPAANACARTYAARGGLSSTFPQGYHEGGTEGAIVVTASMGSVPCGHPLPHEEPGLAWQRCRPEPGLQGRGAGVCQELPQSRAPGGVGNSRDSPGGGRPHTRRQVLAAAVARPEGGWCLRIYLRTEVCLSLSGFVLGSLCMGRGRGRDTRAVGPHELGDRLSARRPQPLLRHPRIWCPK